MERAHLHTTHIEGLFDDYAKTLAEWTARFDARYDEAVRLVGSERARVWRVYLRAARHGFETGFEGVYQVLGRRPG
jgi:cyclopropane-fatty-acyl-phospholipid synthase